MSTPTPLRLSSISGKMTPIKRNKLTFRAHTNRCHKFTKEDLERRLLVHERDRPIRLSQAQDCFLSVFDVLTAEGNDRARYAFSSSDGALSRLRGIEAGGSMSFPQEDQHYKRLFKATRPRNTSNVAKRTHVNLRSYCNDYVAKYFKPLEDIGELLKTSLTAIDTVGRIATRPDDQRDEPTVNRIVLYGNLFKLNVRKLLQAFEKDARPATSDGVQREAAGCSSLNGAAPQTPMAMFESASTLKGPGAPGTQDGVGVPLLVRAVTEDVVESTEVNYCMMSDVGMDTSQEDGENDPIDGVGGGMRKKRCTADQPDSKRPRTEGGSILPGESLRPEAKWSLPHEECDSNSDDDVMIIAEMLKPKKGGKEDIFPLEVLMKPDGTAVFRRSSGETVLGEMCGTCLEPRTGSDRCDHGSISLTPSIGEMSFFAVNVASKLVVFLRKTLIEETQESVKTDSETVFVLLCRNCWRVTNSVDVTICGTCWKRVALCRSCRDSALRTLSAALRSRNSEEMLMAFPVDSEGRNDTCVCLQGKCLPRLLYGVSLEEVCGTCRRPFTCEGSSIDLRVEDGAVMLPSAICGAVPVDAYPKLVRFSAERVLLVCRGCSQSGDVIRVSGLKMNR
jgi:hypothetical protein